MATNSAERVQAQEQGLLEAELEIDVDDGLELLRALQATIQGVILGCVSSPSDANSGERIDMDVEAALALVRALRTSAAGLRAAGALVRADGDAQSSEEEAAGSGNDEHAVLAQAARADSRLRAPRAELALL